MVFEKMFNTSWIDKYIRTNPNEEVMTKEDDYGNDIQQGGMYWITAEDYTVADDETAITSYLSDILSKLKTSNRYKFIEDLLENDDFKENLIEYIGDYLHGLNQSDLMLLLGAEIFEFTGEEYDG